MITFVACIISCSHKQQSQGLHPNLEISNLELAKAINEYDSLIQSEVKDKKYILNIWELCRKDSSYTYTIDYITSAERLSDFPISLAEVNGKYIIVSYVWNDNVIYNTSKKMQEEIAKIFFPEEYKRLNKGETSGTFINEHPSYMSISMYKNKIIKKTFVHIPEN